MSRWLPVLLIALFAAQAMALPVELDAKPVAKAFVAAPQATSAELLAAARQGGDTFASALPINSVPFTETGTTVGYADDYDNDCSSGVVGTAPDVVYAFTAPATGSYSISLCGSAFDTKLYIDEAGLSLVACNDDYDLSLSNGDPCFQNARIDNFQATAGQVYYLVVDGFSGAGGAYTISVDAATACDVPTPAEIIQEGEPALATGQTDSFNCGCTCDAGFGVLALEADPLGQVVVDVVQGWRDFGIRDRDWFRFTAGASGWVHVEFESEVGAIAAVYGNADCLDLIPPAMLIVDPCTPGSVDVAVAAGAEFYIQATTVTVYPPNGILPASNDAVLTVSGLATGVPVSPTSWGSVKGMYR